MQLLTLLYGLVLFLGVHSIRIFGEETRNMLIDSWGKNSYRVIYSVPSLVGLLLIIMGYIEANLEPVYLWNPPTGMRHLTILLMLVSTILLIATYIPNNHIKLKLRHPMTVGVKVWAFAHLLSNGTLADLVLFGSFLLWSILIYRNARSRPVEIIHPNWRFTALTILAGTAIWFVFMKWLHLMLFGVSPV